MSSDLHGPPIRVRGASTHNLARVDLDLPRGELIGFTGVSGSGKSSLAFDTLHAEGQRRLLEVLAPRLRGRVDGLPRPEVDLVTGLPPTIGVAAEAVALGPRSTVATRTDIQDLLRALWAHRGVARCPGCGRDLPVHTAEQVVHALGALPEGTRLTLLAPVARKRAGPLGELLGEMARMGFARFRLDGELHRLDEPPAIDGRKTHDLDLVVDRIRVTSAKEERLGEAAALAWSAGRGRLIALVHGEHGDEERFFADHPVCPDCEIELPLPSPGLFSFNTADGACARCGGLGRHEGATCAECGGSRLSANARSFRVGALSLAELLDRPIAEATAWISSLQADGLTDPLRAEITRRAGVLVRLGLGGVALGRGADSLSSGEARRLQLAAAVSGELSGALFVVDEPTSGLGPADSAAVLGVLRELVEAGNTVIAVSHDLAIVSRCAVVVDFGPGAGASGGRILFVGPPEELAAQDSPTGRWLRGALSRPAPAGRRLERWLELTGVPAPWGGELSLRAPLQAFTVLSGPSGSGKTVLLEDALGAALAMRLHGAKVPPLPFTALEGAGSLIRLVRLSRAPVGRSIRSTVATAAGLWGPVRRLLADTREARVRGLSPEHFSFNRGPGRCEACEGAGVRVIRLHLLPDVMAPCERCEGRRFGAIALSVRFRGANAAELLEMTASEARRHFGNQPALEPRLAALEQAGLGYLRLGQPADTLSGGEAQRVRLARELGSPGVVEGALYLLDGPSTGLHAADSARLAEVLQDLTARGGTVIAADNDPVLIGAADHTLRLAR